MAEFNCYKVRIPAKKLLGIENAKTKYLSGKIATNRIEKQNRENKRR
jgi:hypothetical protein